MWPPIISTILLLLNTVAGLLLFNGRGGFRAQAAYFICWLLYTVYIVYIPLRCYYGGIHTFEGIEIAAWQQVGLTVYAIGFTCFNLGYWFKAYDRYTLARTYEEYDVEKTFWGSYWPDVFFWAPLALVLWNFSMAGVNLLYIFNPEITDYRARLYLVQPAITYLKPLQDTVVAALILMWVFLVPNWKRWLYTTLGVLLFLVGGWRYRLIILALALFVNWVISLPRTLESQLKLMGIALVGVLGIVLLTLNRYPIAERDFQYLTVDVTQFTDSTLIDQTGNSQAFATLLKYMDAKDLGHDYGLSSFAYIPLRVVPGRLFPEGKKPLPPLMINLARSVGREPGKPTPALSNVEEYYYAFGYSGVVVLCFLFGWLVASFPVRLNRRFGRVWYVILSAILFQLITRGYLPQHIELFCYMALPIIALYLLAFRSPVLARRIPGGDS